MFYILFAAIGGVLGYLGSERVGVNPVIGGGVGAVGGLIGGALMGTVFKIMLSVIGAAIGAAILIFLFKEFSQRK